MQINRKIKWGINASILHLVLFTFSNILFSLPLGPKYEILGYLGMPAALYELPLIFLFTFLNTSIDAPNTIWLTYTVGTLFYFVLGFLLACFFSFFSEKKD